MFGPAGNCRQRRPVLEEAGIYPGARVKTANGYLDGRDLRAGDLVLTRDRGYQPLLWTGRFCRPAASSDPAPFLPVHVAPMALEQSGAQATLLAPAQFVALTDRRYELLFGSSTVLCPAHALTHKEGVTPMRRPRIAWVWLLTASADLVLADGLWLHTMVPDMAMLRNWAPQTAQALCAAIPKLRYEWGLAAYQSALKELNAAEAGLI